MQIRAIALIALQTVALCLGGRADAQLTISEPDPATESIRQVSLSAPEGIVAARRAARSRQQIRVKVQYLMVDQATRWAIYEDVDAKAIRTTTQIPKSTESVPLNQTPAPVSSRQQISSPSRVTSCVLSESEMNSILQKAIESASSDVAVSPSVIVLDGSEAEMNDVVQRPFVVDMRVDGDVIKPAMHVLDDGTRLRLLVELTDWSGEPDSSVAPGQPIQLTCEISASHILDVKSDHVFGVQDQPVPVQVPIHQEITAIASEELGKGQALMVDPHVTKTKSVQSQSGVPVLARIPYVGRTFRNIEVDVVQQHLMVLLQPSIEKSNR